MITRYIRTGVLAAALAAAVFATAAQASDTDRSAVFNTNCSMCHQLAGAGVPGEFPRLAGRVGRIAASATGRGYLERVVLFGMAGEVTVDGTPIVGVMPSFSSLSNQELADALNYVASLDAAGHLHWKGARFEPADFAAVRTTARLSPTQVHQLRAAALKKQRRSGRPTVSP